MKKQLKNILLVEDEPDIQEIAKLTLESIGDFQVELSNNGQEALDKLQHYTPDLILMDVMMPIMDGPSTYQQIKDNNSTANIPTIFMTAKVQQSEIESYMNLGILGVISKPFDPMKLVDELTTLYNKHCNNDNN